MTDRLFLWIEGGVSEVGGSGDQGGGVFDEGRGSSPELIGLAERVADSEARLKRLDRLVLFIVVRRRIGSFRSSCAALGLLALTDA